MNLRSHKPTPIEEHAALAAATAARAAGLSWRQIEAQLRSAGIAISHVTLRAKLLKVKEQPLNQGITRAALVKELRPMINARRDAGLTIGEIATELTTAGFAISTASLRVYLSKADRGAESPREKKEGGQHG